MKKKLFLRLIIVLPFLFACDKDIYKDANEAILGKWQIKESGTTEEDLSQANYWGVDEYFEYKADGTIWWYSPYSVSDEYKYFQSGTYMIDSEYLYQNDRVYKYSFNGDKLKIWDTNPRYPGNLDILYNNIFVYQRKK